jgi:hypothetical protein
VLTAVGLLVGEVVDDGEELLRGVAAQRLRSCRNRLRGSGEAVRGRPFSKLLERVRSEGGVWVFSRVLILGMDGPRRGEWNWL